MGKTKLDIDTIVTSVVHGSYKDKVKEKYVPSKLKLGAAGLDCLIKTE